MDSRKITETMIDTALTRGLKEMEDDPKRTIRKLADMGKQFSTGRFQPKIFEIIQTLLENENSPYYDLLQYFLKHTDHNNAKRFGINIGYYSWTYYARTLREKAKEKGYSIPWSINFTYATNEDADNRNTLSCNQIRYIITQARELGINTFAISLMGSATPTNDLFNLFEDFPESAFFLLLGDCQITVAQQDKLKKSGNVLLLVNCASLDALSTCDALNASGNLYSIYYVYNDKDVELLEQRSFYSALSKFPACMLFLIPKDSQVRNAGPIVKDIRMEQKCPYFIWDFPYDSLQISKILSDEELLLTIDKNGNVYTTSDTGLVITKNDISLEDILSEIMPKIRIA